MEEERMLIGDYFDRCRQTTNIEIDIAVKRYYNLIPLCTKIETIIISLQYYDKKIVPFFGSAFSFDMDCVSSYPDSLQVIYQRAELESFRNKDIDPNKILSVFSSSYLYILDGILFLNMFPYSSIDPTDKERLCSDFNDFFTRLLLNRITSSNFYSNIKIFLIGDGVKNLFQQCSRTFSKIITRHYKLQTIGLVHPASITHSYQKHKTTKIGAKDFNDSIVLTNNLTKYILENQKNNIEWYYIKRDIMEKTNGSEQEWYNYITSLDYSTLLEYPPKKIIYKVYSRNFLTIMKNYNELFVLLSRLTLESNNFNHLFDRLSTIIEYASKERAI